MNDKPRLLVVSPLLPWPLDAGGKLRMYHILKGMSARYRITLLTLAVDEENSEENRKPFDFLQDLVMIPISQGRVWQVLRMFANLPRWLAGMPAETVVKRSSALLRACRQMAGQCRFEAVQIEFTQNIQYLDAFEGSGIPSILVAHDVSYVSHERRAEVSKGLRKWFWSREARMMRYYEQVGWARFNRIVAMSAVDRDIILRHVPNAQIDVAPNGVDTADLQPVEKGETPTLIFVGWMRHLPNPDAVTWFLDEIWPLIKAGHASVRFAIVGKGLPEYLKRRVEADDRVDYRGYVDDVGRHVGEAWISVVPLRIGSGTRLKILESMALGTPVVATTVGAEGIAARNGEHLGIADAPADFSRAVLELLADRARRHCMASYARSLVESDYDWEAIAEAAGDAVARAIEGAAR